MVRGKTPRDRVCEQLVSDILSSAQVLVRAYVLAKDAPVDPWQFALRLAELNDCGLGENELRWLLAKGYIKHAREVSPSDEGMRCFRRGSGFEFKRGSCFVLTSLGFSDLYGHGDADTFAQTTGNIVLTSTGRRPIWRKSQRTLHFGSELVKTVRAGAFNQERVLDVFEAACWPISIANPLLQLKNADPIRSVRETIDSLNRRQRTRLLNFRMRQRGSTITWEPARRKQ